LFEFEAVSYDVSRWPTAGGAQGFPKPDRNPFGVSKVCSKSISATSSSWMQTLQACVKMSIISVRTEYLRATGYWVEMANFGGEIIKKCGKLPVLI
jgi:hypothetical protein